MLFGLIVAVHLLVLLCWPRRMPVAADGAHSAFEVVFIAPQSRGQRPIEDRPEPVARKRLPAPAPRVHTPAMVLVAPPAAVAEPLSVPPPDAPAPVDADSTRDRALATAGAVDKELRRTSVNKSERKLSYQASKFERAMALAHIDRAPPKVEELVMRDGRRLSRMGNNCAYMESNALTRGRDVIQNGVRTVWESCKYVR